MNRVNFIGRVMGDVIYKSGDTGNKSMIRFNVSSNDGKDKNGGWLNTNITCVAWDKSADYTYEKNISGKFVCIDGQLKNNNWTDKNGIKHYNLQIVANGKIEVFDSPFKKVEASNDFYKEEKTEDIF